ncbi:MAG: hypothetical protein N2578_03915, partial [Bdellovibrionaceae bacterium]|nr:hypothetical protein [Pseudobdellovibrionaceae bacterium]
LSTVSRENVDVAAECLSLGAADYIEKPAMANLRDRADEIRSKLKLAAKKLKKSSSNPTVEKEFIRKFRITNPERKLRAFYVGLGDLNDIKQILSSVGPSDPPIVVVPDTNPDLFKDMLAGQKKINFTDKLRDWPQPGSITVVSQEGFLGLSLPQSHLVSIWFSRIPPQSFQSWINAKRENLILVLNDQEPSHEESTFAKNCDYCVPFISYISVSDEMFVKRLERKAA